MLDSLSLISDDAWVLAIACLVSIACSLVGCFLVVRKMSMLGDAISHTVLFGLVVAYLLSGSRSIPLMLGSAALVGVLTAYLTSVLHEYGRLQEDASIGVTFTTLFALGVILISAFAGAIDLDQDCVLYGEIAFAPFDRLYPGGVDIGPRAFWLLAVVTLFSLLFVVVGYRRLSIVCFDPVLATSLGIVAAVWHYSLMTAVSLVTVASFDAVGAILVVALLVVPANTAFLFCRSMRSMLCWSCVFAVVGSIGGIQLAAVFDASISAAIALCCGAELVSTLGLIWLWDWLKSSRVAESTRNTYS